jgi:hypothetical protein
MAARNSVITVGSTTPDIFCRTDSKCSIRGFHGFPLRPAMPDLINGNDCCSIRTITTNIKLSFQSSEKLVAQNAQRALLASRSH